MFDQCIGTEDHPWCAKTTLDGAVVYECSLERMKLSFPRDSFDRRDLLPLTGDCQEEAAVLGLSVDEYSAGPAHAAVTAFLGSCQPELIPEHIQERLTLFDRHGMLFAVDSEDEDLEAITS